MCATHWARLDNGVCLPYTEQGDPDGPAVLLLHGYADSRRFFEPMLPYLPAWMRVLAPDQRGHGDADKPPGGYAVADFAGDVGRFLRASGIGTAVIVGHSSGGYVAQRYAVDHPEQVAGLVLVGAPFTLRGRRPPFAGAVERLTDPVTVADVRQVMGTIPLFGSLEPEYLSAMVAEGTKVPAHVWRKTLTGLIEAEPPASSRRIAAPTLVVWGDRDGLLPRDDQEALVASVPGARFVVHAGAGHLVLWDRPHEVAADVTEFVRGLPAPPAAGRAGGLSR